MRSARVARLLVPLLALAAGACATPHPGNNTRALADPYEKTNRKIYAFNKKLDKYAALPATRAYRAVVPGVARRGVSNVFSNIQEPLSFANALAQGKVGEALRTLDRFVINSVIGLGGLVDPATKVGHVEEPEDFGQTLAWWGINSGPYLMLPLIGPSTFRDGVGFAVDTVADPFDYGRAAVVHFTFPAKAGKFAAQVIDLRSRLIDSGADDLLANSLDEYATVRSAYLQRRQSLIYDGNPPDVEDDVPADAPLAPGATPPAPAPPVPPRQ